MPVRGTDVTRAVPWSFVSCDTGLRKPDPRAWEHALETLGAAPHEVLFVDDREGNVRAARELGIGALRFEGADHLRDELGRLAVLPPTT